MSRLAPRRQEKVLKALRRNGVSDRRPGKGSHIVAADPEDPARWTTVPGGEVPVGTLRDIVGQIGDDRDHFAEKLSKA